MTARPERMKEVARWTEKAEHDFVLSGTVWQGVATRHMCLPALAWSCFNTAM